MSFGSHESGEILDPAGETRGSGIEAGIEVFEEGMPGGTDGDDDIGIFFGERFQVFLGQGEDSLAVPEMMAGRAATHLLRRHGHAVAEIGQGFDDTLTDLGKEVLDQTSLKKIGLGSICRLSRPVFSGLQDGDPFSPGPDKRQAPQIAVLLPDLLQDSHDPGAPFGQRLGPEQ